MAAMPLAPAYGALSSFDPRLESLRGLAALLVCVHHGMTVFVDNANLVVMDALLFAFNSAAAVIFFFVLSGYLLGRVGARRRLRDVSGTAAVPFAPGLRGSPSPANGSSVSIPYRPA
jgi:peptidoglycan/LPS O-acetylase OafA/YrhL